MTISTEPDAIPSMTAAGFLLGAKARQTLDAHRPIRESIGEGGVVLLREQRRRHQHRHLLARLHGDECGAQRDLGLAEADVAANDAVHRFARFQIDQHLFDGGGLVGGFLEAKSRLKGTVFGLSRLHATCPRGLPGASRDRGAPPPRRGCAAPLCAAPSATVRRRACAAARSRPALRCSARPDAALEPARRACRRRHNRAPETRPCSPPHPWSCRPT